MLLLLLLTGTMLYTGRVVVSYSSSSSSLRRLSFARW